MSGLTIGSETLSPTFTSNVTEYTATAANASAKITATATDTADTISVKFNGTSVANKSTQTFVTGENTIKVTVTDSVHPGNSTTYTVVVTKSE